MLRVLQEIEKLMPYLLNHGKVYRWNSLYIDYHPPIVERLWCQWGKYRIYLHRIHTCLEKEALFHPHPWSSAMKILSGVYEMRVGYGSSEKEPPRSGRIILAEGSYYEMVDPNEHHYVRPLTEIADSLMVTGEQRDRPAPKATKKLGPLTSQQIESILTAARHKYFIKSV